MAELALAVYLVYLALALGLRSLLQGRVTGSTGFVGIGGRPGSAEWFAGVLFAVALAFAILGRSAGCVGPRPIAVRESPIQSRRALHGE